MPPFETFFLQAPDGGHRLCVHTPPSAPLRGVVLHAHAFGEEMNKSRRMAALGARALAQAGFAVLQIDLIGCGDSSGDFADATWAQWLDDLHLGADWLARHHDAPLWLWGHRAGALLAGALRPRLPSCNLLLWNPVLQGKAVTQQMLRLKAAADWAAGDGGRAATAAAKAELAAGRAVEIAGYVLTPAMASALDGASLAPPPGAGARLVWLEVAGRDGEPALSPAAQAQLPRWRAAGWQVQAHAVPGPLFWQTVEIEDAPALPRATADALVHPETAEAAPA